MDIVFIQLAIILLAAFIVSYIVRALKQPIIIGYILAGVIVSALVVNLGYSQELINIFSQFGVAFLLFIVGLHLNPKVIKEIGVASLSIGLLQVILTFGVGFLVAWGILGFSVVASFYVGIALAFSSTIIVMKLLSDNHQIDSLYGKISIGILIIQDLIAIIVLMIISSVGKGKVLVSSGFEGVLFGALLIIGLFFIGYLILPRIMKKIAKSQELLFLFSLCWCFLASALFSYVGFSLEIGALVAGVILSISPYATEISSKIRPIRDFFLIIFFIILGLQIQISTLGSILVEALILSFVVIIIKPLIVMFLMKQFRYTKRTNFFTGGILSQISEFSLIIVGLAIAKGSIGGELMNTMVLTMVLTILISTYISIYSPKLYNKLAKFLVIFEKKKIRRSRKVDKEYDAILFGYNRIGFSILESFKKINKKYLVVDFNPDTVTYLNKFRIPALYGDAFDMELLEELPLEKVKMVVSTIPDLETNKLLLEEVKARNKNTIVILRAHSIEDALELYEEGASYVLTPHFLGGEYVSKMIKHSDVNIADYSEEKSKHIKMLKSFRQQGHQHPDVEKN